MYLPQLGELIDASKLNAVLDESEGWMWDHQDASLQDFQAHDSSLRKDVQEICQNFFQAVESDRLLVEKKLEEEAAKAAAEKPEDEDEDHDTRKLKKADRMRLVIKNKDEGTELFKGGNYRPAAARYHKALTHSAKFFDLSPEDEVEVKSLKISLHLNLASCYLKMENIEPMMRNIEDAIALDPNNAKAYFRRAQYHEAKKDWEKVSLTM
jgi:tetratricopeptide (TPR) repeat protein